MPFKKITSGKDKGKYRSPLGRIMTLPQIRAYHAKSGKKK
jgi:hypothetical protein